MSGQVLIFPHQAETVRGRALDPVLFIQHENTGLTKFTITEAGTPFATAEVVMPSLLMIDLHKAWLEVYRGTMESCGTHLFPLVTKLPVKGERGQMNSQVGYTGFYIINDVWDGLFRLIVGHPEGPDMIRGFLTMYLGIHEMWAIIESFYKYRRDF